MNTDYEAALNIRFDSDAGDDLTLRGYFRKLLVSVWEDGESFSGKRPFGNSGWEWEVYLPLVKAGFIAGKLDEDGYLASLKSEKKAYAYVSDLILYALRDPTPEITHI